MSDYSEAADAVLKLAKQHEHLVKAAEMLQKIGSFEQAADEAKARSVKAQKDSDDAADRLSALKNSALEVEGKVKELLAKGKEQASTMIDEAVQKSNELFGTAKAKADDVLRDARIEAERMKADVSASLEQSRVQKANMDALANQAQVKTDTAIRELAELTGKIAQARAEVKRMLG